MGTICDIPRNYEIKMDKLRVKVSLVEMEKGRINLEIDYGVRIDIKVILDLRLFYV